jgi:hypothetical protein
MLVIQPSMGPRNLAHRVASVLRPMIGMLSLGMLSLARVDTSGVT